MVTMLSEPAGAARASDPRPHPTRSGGDTGAAVMRLLGRGIPLTLLIDLWDPAGPDSAGVLADERERGCRPADYRPPPSP